MSSGFPLLVDLSVHPTCQERCPASALGHSPGLEGTAHPQSHSLLLGWQERFPQLGPASGNLLEVSIGDQDLEALLGSGLMGPAGGWEVFREAALLGWCRGQPGPLSSSA